MAPLFLNSAIEVSDQLDAAAALLLGQEPTLPLRLVPGWAPKPVWRFLRNHL